jgi:predicted nucleic-acid-binding protein
MRLFAVLGLHGPAEPGECVRRHERSGPAPDRRAAGDRHRRDRLLRDEPELFLADLVAAETIYVLESFYETPRGKVAEIMRSLLAMGSIVVVDRDVLLRAVEVYEVDRLDFAEAYLVACAESTGVGRVASFDRAIDRVPTVQRIEPGAPGRA